MTSKITYSIFKDLPDGREEEIAHGLDESELAGKVQELDSDSHDWYAVVAVSSRGLPVWEKSVEQWLAERAEAIQRLHALSGLDQGQIESRLRFLRQEYDPDTVRCRSTGTPLVSESDNMLREICQGLLLEINRLQETVKAQGERIEVLEEELRSLKARSVVLR